jgi:hypothetical protein
MGLSRLRLGRIAIGWAALLWLTGLVLPNLDSRAGAHPAVQVFVLIFYALLTAGTPIGLANYFNRAWCRIAEVPNRTAYVVWLSLESIAGILLLGVLAYATLSLTVFRFR